MLHLLYIEDNATIRKRVANTLRGNDFTVSEIATAAEAMSAFEKKTFDLVLLDLLLPDGNGIDLLKKLRLGKNANVPVIIISALGENIDARVSGLDAGANDYLSKPFSVRELIARIRAVMRSATPASESLIPSFIQLNGGKLNLQHPCILRDDGSQIQLSMKEFCLFRYFAEHPKRIISIEEILTQVWKLNPPATATASPVVLISRLRKKTEGLCVIEVVRGNGYRFSF